MRILILVSSIIVALFALYTTFAYRQTNFEDIAIGEGAKSIFGSTSEGGKFHYSAFTLEDIQQIKKKNTGNKSIVLMGASQLHSISPYYNGDQTAVQLLQAKLQKRGVSLFCISMPNASLRELYISFEAILNKYSKIDLLVLGLIFDDMRESIIRNKMESLLTDERLKEKILRSHVGRSLLQEVEDSVVSKRRERKKLKKRKRRKTEKKNENPQVFDIKDSLEKNALDGTNQYWAENLLTSLLEDNFELWRLRKEARGHIILLNKRLTKIAANYFRTKYIRKDVYIHISKSMYESNLASLKTICDVAAAKGVKVLIYHAPQPSDQGFFWDKKVYAQYLQDIKNCSLPPNVQLVDLRDAVDNSVWGSVRDSNGVIISDYFHFNANGHQQLSDSLFPHIKEALLEK